MSFYHLFHTTLLENAINILRDGNFYTHNEKIYLTEKKLRKKYMQRGFAAYVKQDKYNFSPEVLDGVYFTTRCCYTGPDEIDDYYVIFILSPTLLKYRSDYYATNKIIYGNIFPDIPGGDPNDKTYFPEDLKVKYNKYSFGELHHVNIYDEIIFKNLVSTKSIVGVICTRKNFKFFKKFNIDCFEVYEPKKIRKLDKNENEFIFKLYSQPKFKHLIRKTYFDYNDYDYDDVLYYFEIKEDKNVKRKIIKKYTELNRWYFMINNCINDQEFDKGKR